MNPIENPYNPAATIKWLIAVLVLLVVCTCLAVSVLAENGMWLWLGALFLSGLGMGWVASALFTVCDEYEVCE